MRHTVLLSAFAVAACGQGDAQSEGTAIECAIGGAAGFATDCRMERHDRDGERLLIVRHPDGAFRRFELGVPGQGIVTADGVEQAVVELGEGMVEVRVGADRYRLPVAQ